MTAGETGGEGFEMTVNRRVALVTLGILAGAAATPAAAAEERAACPPEVARARAMVAKAQDVIKAGKPGSTQVARTPTGDPASGPAVTPVPSPGSGYGGGRTPQGDPASGPARTPQGEPASGAARGLATSAASDISPWNPQPTDKTLNARTVKARRLTAQAAKFCAAGKMDDAKAKALEAITVLNPK